MRRVTTTKKINDVIAHKWSKITRAEIYYKTSHQTENIDADRIQENFKFLCESGCFADAIGWHYEIDAKSNGYIAECGRMNPDSEIIIVIYLSIGEGTNVEDVDKALLYEEE